MHEAQTPISHALEGPRPARVEERDDLLAMINHVFRVMQGRAPTVGADWPHVYTPENLANVMVMCDPGRDAGAQPERGSVPGKIVASTGVWVSDVVIGEVTLRVGGINCVGTLPEYRRLGLGSKVMAAAHQRMRDLGCQVGLLNTGIMNWYRRMGWESGGMLRSYQLNRGNITLLPEVRPALRVRVVEVGEELDTAWDAQGAEAVVRLRTAAQLGATRSVRDFRALTLARRVQRVLLAEDTGVPVAYLLVREQTVIEWAGATQDVLALVRACFESMDDREASTSQRGQAGTPMSLGTLTLQTPGPHPRWQHPLVTALVRWLDVVGIPYRGDYVGMLYIIDPQGVLDAYGLDTIEIKTRQAAGGGERFDVRVGQASLSLNRSQLVKLLFGPERLLDREIEPLPLPFWQWFLEIV